MSALLLTKSSGSENHIGKTAYVDDFVENLECAYSNFMQRLRVNSVTESKFLFWVLNSYIARIQFKIFSKSNEVIFFLKVKSKFKASFLKAFKNSLLISFLIFS